MEKLITKYREMTFQMYNGMTSDKQKECTYEFINDSLNQSEVFFKNEDMTYEAEAVLKQKIHRLKNIKFILENFYEGTYTNIDKEEFNRLTNYSFDCNNLIIEQIMDLTFNQGMTSEERHIQLTGVLPYYFFVQFELKKIITFNSILPKTEKSWFNKLFSSK